MNAAAAAIYAHRHPVAYRLERVKELCGLDPMQSGPRPRIVLDHFGWPTDLSDAGRRTYLDRHAALAGSSNVATRLEAIGTIFGAWTLDQVRRWLLAIVDLFGPDRCMLGSNLPIERLCSSFAPLYRAYDEILVEHASRAREMLLRDTAWRWYGLGDFPAWRVDVARGARRATTDITYELMRGMGGGMGSPSPYGWLGARADGATPLALHWRRGSSSRPPSPWWPPRSPE